MSAIASAFARQEPLAEACSEAVLLSLDLARCGSEEDQQLACTAIALGVGSLALLIRDLQLCCLDVELATA